MKVTQAISLLGVDTIDSESGEQYTMNSISFQFGYENGIVHLVNVYKRDIELFT